MHTHTQSDILGVSIFEYPSLFLQDVTDLQGMREQVGAGPGNHVA